MCLGFALKCYQAFLFQIFLYMQCLNDSPLVWFKGLFSSDSETELISLHSLPDTQGIQHTPTATT